VFIREIGGYFFYKLISGEARVPPSRAQQAQNDVCSGMT
jgi:hypothetical protein